MTSDALRTPAELGVLQTLDFCSLNLPPPPRQILEIGCGDGALASKLAGNGYDLVAIDIDADLIDQACRAGVNAEVADWLTYRSRTVFDTILFTRSLHHISPLEQAITRIAEFLRSDGLVLVEDFAFSECDRATAEWGSRIVKDLSTKVDWRPAPDAFAEKLRIARDPFDVWHADHRLHLHTSADMVDSLERHGYSVNVTTSSYLYRYLVQGLEPTAGAAGLLQSVLEQEKEAIQAGQIQAIGRRLVVRPQAAIS